MYEEWSMSGIRINALGLVGAVIGVVAIFSTWFTYIVVHDLNLVDVVDHLDKQSKHYLPALLFILGTVIAFISPTGGLVQIAGVGYWFARFWSDNSELPSEIGSYLGLVSAVIVLASLARPVGIGYQSKPIGIIGRLVTISTVRKAGV